MREHTTGSTKANEIRMRRSVDKRLSFVAVEGDSDARLFKKFINRDTCQVVPCFGKENVFAAIQILEVGRVKGLLGIVDTDFDVLEGTSKCGDNLCRTDTHDIETMIIGTQVLESILIEYGSEDRLARLGETVRGALIRCALPIGYLRWVSLRHGLNLKFEGIEFHKFVDQDRMSTDVDKLLREVKNKSQMHSLDEIVIKNMMESLTVTHPDPWMVCNGHDLVEALSLGLRKSFGSKDPNKVKPDVIQANLRIAYSVSDFCGTLLCRCVMEWETRNAPYSVLKEEVRA
jgi:hypothetical protein